jgi:hypothetical protein
LRIRDSVDAEVGGRTTGAEQIGESPADRWARAESPSGSDHRPEPAIQRSRSPWIHRQDATQTARPIGTRTDGVGATGSALSGVGASDTSFERHSTTPPGASTARCRRDGCRFATTSREGPAALQSEGLEPRWPASIETSAWFRRLLETLRMTTCSGPWGGASSKQGAHFRKGAKNLGQHGALLRWG